MFLKNENLGFKIGLILAIAHLCYFIVLLMQAVTSTHEQAGMGLGMIFMILDIFLYFLAFPLSTLLSFFTTNDSLHFYLLIIIQYGILGTLCWFFIPIGIRKIVKKFIRPKVKEQFK